MSFNLKDDPKSAISAARLLRQLSLRPGRPDPATLRMVGNELSSAGRVILHQVPDCPARTAALSHLRLAAGLVRMALE